MASKLTKAQKTQLGELLALGHRKFGPVAMRRPYRDDDEGGGTGAAQLLFEEHPLLAQQPIGASSDLTFVVSENRESLDQAEQREQETVPQLRKALEMKHSKQFAATPKHRLE